MRKNIFLHFLNRDSREIFGIYQFQTERHHIALLKEALNLSVLLCEEHCVIPPGFAIEDELAFGLSEVNQAFFANRLILLPMRESNLTEYAEKKRLEYSPQRDRYSGLFDDRRLDFLGKHAVGIVPRKTHIGEGIVSGWEAAPDRRGRLWTDAKRLVAPALIELIRKVPSLIAGEGAAVTWAEISGRLPNEARPAHQDLRISLQHIYFRQYCQEFQLAIMCELPFARDDFFLRTERRVYSFARFAEFLDVFSLRKLLTRCSADTLCVIKRRPGLIEFVDAYQGIARLASTRTDLSLLAGRTRRASTFDWDAFAERHPLLLGEPDGLAIAELDDALLEAAKLLTEQNSLPRRLDGKVRTFETSRIEDYGKAEPSAKPSCFISYSTKDKDFADRIYADLQNKGVCCWFAPHDLPIGSKVLDEIDAAIRVRDKVLLILSEHSIKSEWVEDEVKTAYEEERKRGQTVLFPIRLDDVVMETNEAWAAKLRADRNIGDFRRWKDDDAYTQSFAQVIRDLMAPDKTG